MSQIPSQTPSDAFSLAIVYFDAGSGHRSAARGLATALCQTHPDWDVRVINLLDIFAYDKAFHRIVKAGIDYFNWCLKHEHVFDLGGLVNLSLLCHDLVKPAQIANISRFWGDAPPDAVVSVTPMYNPVLFRSALAANPNVLCITIPVDFEEFKARYWYTPKFAPAHYIVATERLEMQARRAGIPEGNIHRVGGMIIDPAFYSPPPADIPGEVARLGLDPDLPTGLVSFGGQGSVVVRRIAEQLARSELKVNMIFLCGRNPDVYNAIRDMPTPYRKQVFAYTEEPPHYYHHLADFLIGKPGSMTITEALITQTPFIFIKARGMAPVQRGNEQWVLEHGTGLAADTRSRLIPAIQQILASTSFTQKAQEHYHRGVFETADVVARLVP